MKVKQKPKLKGGKDEQPPLKPNKIDIEDFNLENLQTNMIQSQRLVREKCDIEVLNQYTEQVFEHRNKDVNYLPDRDEIQLQEIFEEHLNYNKNFQEQCLISYFDCQLNMYVYCGKLKECDNIPQQAIYIPSKEDGIPKIIIKVRTKQKLLVDQLIQEQSAKDDDLEQNNHQLTSNNSNTNNMNNMAVNPNNRVKERQIGEVVEKVALWRRLYTGFYDENGQVVQMPLDQAALKVGISKKTLDDYLLQIRCGKKYGFDFNRHQDEKIGTLRTFVKTHKTQEGPLNMKDEEDQD